MKSVWARKLSGKKAAWLHQIATGVSRQPIKAKERHSLMVERSFPPTHVSSAKDKIAFLAAELLKRCHQVASQQSSRPARAAIKWRCGYPKHRPQALASTAIDISAMLRKMARTPDVLMDQGLISSFASQCHDALASALDKQHGGSHGTGEDKLTRVAIVFEGFANHSQSTPSVSSYFATET